MRDEKRGWIPDTGISSPFRSLKGLQVDLAFTYPKQLSATDRADTLCRWSAVFHSDFLGVLHFPLSPALHTICLH